MRQNSKIVRFGISLPTGLIKKFDQLIKKQGYINRSKALADLIRQELIKEEWNKDREVIGVISLIYNHHKRELVNRLIDIQHNFGKVTISSQHIHLDEDNCLEIIATKGSSKRIQKLADLLKSINGVKHVTLNISSTGKNIE